MITVFVALLVVPASASAAPHFASVGGSSSVLNTTCPANDPCSLDHALAIPLLPGDEVIAAPGNYDLGAAGVTVPAGVILRAADGQPAPAISGSPASGATVTAAGAGSTLRRLRISNATAGGGAAALGAGAIMASSSGWGSGAGGIGVLATGPAPVLHDVTAVGDGIGLAAAGGAPAVTGTGVLAQGGTSDIGAVAGNPTFTLANSNFDPPPAGTTAVGGGNQTAQPKLANAAAGDFHELPGSPTIDAGLADPAAGLADLDGGARVLGLAPDIGAYEYLPHPPLATTGAPAGITTTAANLTGTVNPHGVPTSYHFDYGSGPGYGQSTAPQDAGAGTADVPVSTPVAGLTPGSIVHYRLVATSPDGTANGLDRLLIVVPAGGTLPGGTLPQGAGPQILAIGFPVNPVVGQPTTLTVRADDPKRPVNAIAVDFAEHSSFFAESACREVPRSKLFDGVGGSTFAVPYTFTQPGVHRVEITLSSGGCGRAKHSTTQFVTIDAAPAPSPRTGDLTGVLGSAACAGARATPSAHNIGLVARATVCLLNGQRRAHGLRPLHLNAKLGKAAKLHNGFMARGRFFAHQGPREPSLGARFKHVHYTAGGGENLGEGSGTPWAAPVGMVKAWMHSPLHRANILERGYRSIGIAVMPQKAAPRPARPGATYTTEFGRR